MRAFLLLLAVGALGVGSIPAAGIAASSRAAQSVPCSVAALDVAINAANAANGSTTLVLARNCTYTLTQANNTTENGPNGLPVITTESPLTIRGDGATIERSSDAAFRIFEVAGSAQLVLENLALGGGLADNQGGAIYNAGSVRIVKGSITDNGTAFGGLSTSSGGAIYNTASGSMSILQSTLSGNGGGDRTGGGAIFNGGTMTIRSSTLTGNVGGPNGSGGAIYNAGTLVVVWSTMSNNSCAGGGGGGAIWNAGSASVGGSTVTGNSGRYGGALGNAGTLLLIASTVSDNVAGIDGGGVWNNSAGGSSVTVVDGTISGNSAGDDGGGIWNDLGTLHLLGPYHLVGNSPDDLS